MLGSLSEADDAVQEAWLRLNRSDASGVENLGGWLTTVVARGRIVEIDLVADPERLCELEPNGPRRLTSEPTRGAQSLVGGEAVGLMSTMSRGIVSDVATHHIGGQRGNRTPTAKGG